MLTLPGRTMSKLRTRLVLMSLIGIVPALAAILYSQSTERHAARSRTLENNLRIARLAAGQQASLLNGARRLLLTLAHVPALWADDVNACHALLSDVLNEHRDLSRLMLANADGKLICSSMDVPLRLPSGADRPWFRHVLDTKTTAIGEYQISRLTGAPNINVAHPLLDRDGNVKRVLIAAIELRTLGALINRLEMPAGATLVVFDRNRTILARHPDPARWVGKQVPSAALRQATDINPSDMTEETDVDGVRRLDVGAPVVADVPTGLYVGMGIERSAAFGQVDRMLQRSLWLLATIAIVAIITAMTSGEFFVLRPIKELIAVTGRLARGNLASRARLGSGPRELGELADAFNSMAAALQTRQLERDHAEQQLRDSEERYRMPFEHAPHPSWVYDVGTLQFMEVNRAACDHYGYTRQEFLAMRITDIQPDDEVPRLLSEVERRVRDAHAAESTAWTHRKKDGTLINVEISSMLVTIAGRPACIVLAHDVSERAQLEHQLRQAQKMEAVGQLAGGVAHDFNNLLTAIMGYSEIALELIDGNEEVAGAVREIERAGARAATLTRQLLAFSRKQLLSPAILDPNAVVGDVDALLRRLIGEHIELRMRLRENLGAVKADPNQLEQVLLNLAVNARDAMPDGGTLTIETHGVDVDEGYARAQPGLSEGRYVVITVSDTGVGMNDATLARIFEPFFTTKSAGEGTGLGLAVVYGIVRQSGGQIIVHSKPGEGATFEIYLPHVDASPEAPLGRHARAKAAGGSETILVAEDEDLVRGLLKTTLTAGGYSVLEARNGVEALEVCQREGASLDLLVTDVVMPKMTGLELARRLAVDHPELKVLCLSGYSAEATAAQRPLDWPFLAKPFMPATLLQRVREVLDSENVKRTA